MFCELLTNIDIVKILELFFATFVGVWAAFKLERIYKSNETKTKNLEQFIYAQGLLQLQQSVIRTLNEFIEPQRNNPQRAGHILPVPIPEIADYLQLSDLRFMLGDKNVLALNIIIIQGKVKKTLDHLRDRNKFHYKAQEVINNKDDTDKHLHDVTYASLHSSTNHLFDDVDELLKIFPKYYDEFQKYGIDTFKSVKPTKIKIQAHDKN